MHAQRISIILDFYEELTHKDHLTFVERMPSVLGEKFNDYVTSNISYTSGHFIQNLSKDPKATK